MRISYALCGLLLAVSFVASSPIIKREVEEDISPLNEVYVFQADEEPADEERTDRDKRKIGIVKLGVTNGIINFVFGKLDAFLDAKTRALVVLDESNKAKNAAFGIDSSQSATSQFISNLISQKIQAGTASIGPLINGATTFISGASSGLAGAFASKFAPLSALSGGASAGGTGGSPVGVLGGLLASKLGPLSSLSSSSGTGGLPGSSSGDSSSSSGGSALAGGAGTSGNAGAGASAGASTGLNLGAFANLGGANSISTTTEDIPEFDRTRVSLDIPPPLFGSGFTLITDISKIASSLIMNSARRTESILETLKPFFRGAFAIKGLPSDNKRN
ncbi:glycine, alanine and asparagine-rich protein [Orussus abietinus]|uniref:glycine, alanine and asparagine-rich protein n=1 Tax=Orussus abietinus TaxID=222816 RepID=UPI000625BD0E|nr:glycine, alanine and asparagine-rich protein [Orussus abietinus]